MSETERQREWRDFEYAIAFGHNRTSATMALARAGGPAADARRSARVCRRGEHDRPQLHDEAWELGLVEETSTAGRLAFRFTEEGLLGYDAWKEQREAVVAVRREEPQSRAPLYRWHAKGVAIKNVDIDAAAERAALAEQRRRRG